MSNDAPNRRIEFIAYDFEHSEETVERGVPPSALVRRSDVAFQPHSSFEVRADNLDLGGLGLTNLLALYLCKLSLL
jgi:hypothetical protein